MLRACDGAPSIATGNKPGKKPMTVRTLWRAIFTGTLIVLGLAAAGPSHSHAEPVTIKMWMHEHPPRIAIDKAIIAEFEKANPDIKIDYAVIAVSEFTTKLLTAFASGSGPDLFNQSVVQVAQYYNSHILAPIDYAAMGYADQKALTGNYLTGFDGIRFAGKLYGVPTEVSNYACYINNTIWKAAGLDPSRDFPKTWEEMPALAEKLTLRDPNGVPRRRGFDFDWPSLPAYWLTLNTMMRQRGANLFDEADYKATFEGPEAVHVLQYLVDWVNKYKLGGPQYTDTRTDFLAGNLATDCSFGIWGIPQMHDAKLDYTVRPLPRFADGKNDNGYDAYAYYMMVNARSAPAVQKAAWKLARFYTDHAVELFTGAGLFVPREDVMAKTGDPDSQVFLTELKKAAFAPRVVGYNQIVDILARGRDAMIAGGQPIASVLPQMNDDMNAVLKREKARAEAMLK
jgi:multiple sugar transport system substrate-binding protein